jgi:hypothetical protein
VGWPRKLLVDALEVAVATLDGGRIIKSQPDRHALQRDLSARQPPRDRRSRRSGRDEHGPRIAPDLAAPARRRLTQGDLEERQLPFAFWTVGRDAHPHATFRRQVLAEHADRTTIHEYKSYDQLGWISPSPITVHRRDLGGRRGPRLALAQTAAVLSHSTVG